MVVMPPPKLNEPDLNDGEVQIFALRALKSTFAFDYINYSEQLSNNSIFFTTTGWDSFLTSLKSSVNNLQFDDMITSEHTKLKPLTITLAVDEKRRYILGGIVGEIPAFGLLVERSIKKYGHRPNKHPVCISTLFDKIKGAIKHNATIQSDEHQTYPGFVKKYFPNATHQCHKGGRACIVGQGELKKLHFDPLFTINHTCAILRANINRLIRKTWCTTKVISNLQDHIDLFIDYYNFSLLQKNKKTPQRFSF